MFAMWEYEEDIRRLISFLKLGSDFDSVRLLYRNVGWNVCYNMLISLCGTASLYK